MNKGHEWTNDDLTMFQVLELVRYGLMNAEEMSMVYSNAVMMTEQCHSVLHSALNYHMRLFAQPVIDLPMARYVFNCSLPAESSNMHFEVVPHINTRACRLLLWAFALTKGLPS